MYVFICQSKDCPLKGKERVEYKITSYYDKTLEDVLHKQGVCPECGKYQKHEPIEVKGFTTTMIGKNIGKG